MPEDFPSFEPPTPFPPWQRRAVPESPGNVSSEPAPTRPVTPEPDVPELDFDQSTVSESDGPETDFDDGPETGFDDGPETDDEDDDSESDDQDDDFESEDDGYDSGYDAGSEFESDDEEYDDDDSEEEDQDFDSDDEDLSALELCLNKLELLLLEVEKYEARMLAVRTEPENDVSHDSDVDPAPRGFEINVSHLNVHNNQRPPRSAAAASTAVFPLACQQNEPVPCANSFSWWLTRYKHAEHRVPILFHVLACDMVAVLAGAALYATFQAAARALLCWPGTITRPVNDFPVAWLAYAPLITVISVALDAVVARECERVLRVRGCRVWAELPVFQLRRRWAGARRQFVNVSFWLFAVQTLVYAAACSFFITALLLRGRG
ncbi:hypothetical protein MY10362_001840 [Beauveria mimosiformis]